MSTQTDTYTTRIDPARVGKVVRARVYRLRSALTDYPSWARAELARLRRAAGSTPGSSLEVLEHILSDEFVLSRTDDTPTDAERAAHLAMTLYALHQQSRSEPMHQDNHGLGYAVHRLLPAAFDTRKDNHPVLRRFQTLGSSDSFEELAHHGRGVVGLLRAQGFPLDYGLLAEQFTRWQRPDGATSVRLAWGRDFYFPKKPEQEENSEDK